MLQQGPSKANDAVDLLIESVQHVVEREDVHSGEIIRTLEPDSESLYWKMQMINSPVFARFVLKYKQWTGLSEEMFDNMGIEIATMIHKQMMAVAMGYKYSIDAKSSETLRDKNNSQSSLIHTLTKNHMERSITMNAEAKKSLGQAMGFGGNDEQQQYQR